MRRRTFLQLGLLAGLGQAAPLGAGGLTAAAPTLHRQTLHHDDRRFGGFSALHLAENGRDCLLMSDRGLFVALRLGRDAQGYLSSAEVLSLTEMRGLRGDDLRREGRDSEGLAVGRDGSLYVSFEGGRRGRIWRYRQPGARPEPMPFDRRFAELPPNGGLEALAIDGRGRLLCMPEEPPGATLPLYRLEAAGWREIGQLPKQGGFKPVSLDCGPDGALYLLERHFTLPLFTSRLSRLPLPQGPAPSSAQAGHLQREILWQSRPGQCGNLEGVSVTRTPMGKLRFTMVNDNNQLPLIRSELVELTLG